MGKAYTVKTAIVADDKFSAKLKGIGEKAKSIASNAKTAFTPFGKGVMSDLGRIKGAMTSIAGLVAGFTVGSFVKGLVGANIDAENLELSMASLVHSSKEAKKANYSYNESLKKGVALTELMRKEAVSTPASFEQIADSFNRMAPLAELAGASLEQSAKFAASVASREAMGGGTGQVTQDVSTLLRGEQGDIGSPQLIAIKDTIAKLMRSKDKKKKAKGLAMIQDALTLSPEERQAAEESWGGQLETFKDQLKELQREAGKPLFQEAKKALTSMSNWIRGNPEKLKQMARDFGEGILKGAIAIKDAFSWLIKNAGTIKDIAVAFGAIWGANRVGQLGKGFIDMLKGPGAAGAGGVGALLGKGGCCCPCAGGPGGGVVPGGKGGKGKGPMGWLTGGAFGGPPAWALAAITYFGGWRDDDVDFFEPWKAGQGTKDELRTAVDHFNKQKSDHNAVLDRYEPGKFEQNMYMNSAPHELDRWLGQSMNMSPVPQTLDIGLTLTLPPGFDFVTGTKPKNVDVNKRRGSANRGPNRAGTKGGLQ